MTTKTYKSLLFYGPQDVRLEDLPFAPLQAGEVRVRIGAATTCGTDLKTYRRGHPLIIKSIPSPFGHEMAGTVSAVADDVADFNVGDRVVVANSAPCFNCFYCQKGKPNLCENLIFLNGAFAESIVVPAPIVRHNLHRIPPHLSFAAAALSEPLACVLHACEHMQIKNAETVAIIGTGPMAFLFVQVIKARGGKSIVIGRNPERLKLASTADATAVINSTTEDVAMRVRDLTHGYGADVAIEAVGQPATWQQAVSLVRKGGRVCLYGGCAKNTDFNLDTYRVHYDEITVSGIFHHTPTIFRSAVALLADGKINTQIFLTTERKLQDLPAILAGLDSAAPLKFVILPEA